MTRPLSKRIAITSLALCGLFGTYVFLSLVACSASLSGPSAQGDSDSGGAKADGGKADQTKGDGAISDGPLRPPRQDAESADLPVADDTIYPMKTGSLVMRYWGKPVAVAGLPYSTSKPGKKGITRADGSFDYGQGQNVTFGLGAKAFTIAGKPKISISELAGGNADRRNNMALLLVNFDADGKAANGIQLSSKASQVDPSLPTAAFMKQLYRVLAKRPKTLFKASLGINLEAPQGEADTVGQPMPFVDLFRTARPFAELSKNAVTAIQTDVHGWPVVIPAALGFARTKLLQGTVFGAIPAGQYFLLYEGKGSVTLSGRLIKKTAPLPASVARSGLLVTLQPGSSGDPEENSIQVVVSKIDSADPLRNIQLIMPGGTCKDAAGYNPFIRVDNATECPAGTRFVRFVDRLKLNRNEIIFNPDYLAVLKNFRVIRMMNFMEASPGISACRNPSSGVVDKACVLASVPWNKRATMDDASWGGSGRTKVFNRRGVPVEVLVELANQLGADPWFNMPHYADDNYVAKFAAYVAAHLDPKLHPHIEYSNETWNSGFLGFHYMEAKGIAAGLNTVPPAYQSSRTASYFARLRYYSRRSVEIFKIWSHAFSGSGRLVRILGTSQGDTLLSKLILEFENAPGNVDALAMAPYFYGCIDRKTSCSKAPKVLSEAKTVDDIFAVIDQPFPIDPSAMQGALNKVSRQADVAVAHHVKLVAYEGGQHLTIMGSLGALNEKEKERFRGLFQAANRDPRMKQRYKTLLDGWRALASRNAAVFTLYTLPQTFYRYGNWGIKEHLNKSRQDSPKYDAALDFQENQGRCWWTGCPK